MTHTYHVTGMTCNGCKASVEEALAKIDDVSDAKVDLEASQVEVKMKSHIPTATLAASLPEKYTLRDTSNKEEKNIFDSVKETPQSKWKQLQPLFLIFSCIVAITLSLNLRQWSTSGAMLDFMGIFFFIFSLFKFFDLKGFANSFSMYDPIAKIVKGYGFVYPFLELLLGAMFLSRFQIETALIVTIILLGITTLGVTKTLLDKKKIQCACLGTVLKLPMTQATFIENAIMIVMAVWMLLK